MSQQLKALELAAKAAGLHLKLLPDDDHRGFAVVSWLSDGPVVIGCRFNRVLFCRSAEEAMIAIQLASKDKHRRPHAH